jgi:hypothetical protein
VAPPPMVTRQQQAGGRPAGQGALFPREQGELANTRLQPTRRQQRRRPYRD